ncbi:D,D-dipeptide ABC transporter permease [Gammaproteobacteria bacterium]|nr:D,D-dipeptide ABC transporter permease [Gammaproteobacteria bacterium]
MNTIDNKINTTINNNNNNNTTTNKVNKYNKISKWLNDPQPHSVKQAKWGQRYQTFRKALKIPSFNIGLLLLIILLVVAIFAPLLAPFDPNLQEASHRLQAPNSNYWLGTDQLGRDVLSRLIFGIRPTFLIILEVTLLATPVGIGIGILAGFYGGIFESICMRLTDIFMALPRLVLALALGAVLGGGLMNAVIAIAITAWPAYARIARAETKAIKNSDYVQAAITQGLSTFTILRTHILPMCMPSIVVRMSFDMAGIILMAAGLGFLGLGAQPPLAEWGAMIASGRDYIFDQWWLCAIPGIAICLASLAFNLLGDGLRDVLDPKY